MSEDALPGDLSSWQEFLSMLNRTFDEAVSDREMMEHSLDRCSVEMSALYDDLKLRSETLLAQEKSTLQAVIDAVPAAICWVSDDFKYQGVNQFVCKFLGKTPQELIGEPVPNDDQLRELFANEYMERSWERTHPNLSGENLIFRLVAKKFQNNQSAVIVAADITKDRELLEKTESQLRQSQKMEAIGSLAGGVAHDFNNLLAVIVCTAELSLTELKAGDPLTDPLNTILTAANRGAALTRQLLAFSRQQVLRPKVIDLNEVITNFKTLINRLIGENIELVLETQQNLPKVLADPGQIEQVLMNLAVNARDAMPHGGKLFIRLEKSQLTQEMQKGHLGSKPGRLGTGVMIDVRDTGTGMDTKTQARVFEPFYTTKEVGKGTGLGLSTVLGIVEQSSGNISLTSELGKDTTFHVFLPSTIQEDTAKHDTEAIEPNVGSHGTILLVEDEDQLRGLIGSILKNNGYTVLDAATPSEALALLKAHNRPIDLLLTDVVMPGMSGGMMAKEMRGIQPSLRVLFMSGYTNDVVVKQGVESSEVSFIQKPFAPNELLRQIKKILD